MRLLSHMLPEIDASAGETVAQSNLAAMGLNLVFGKLGGSAEKISTVIGPYQYVQAQANFNWNALNLTSFRNVQAASVIASGELPHHKPESSRTKIEQGRPLSHDK